LMIYTICSMLLRVVCRTSCSFPPSKQNNSVLRYLLTMTFFCYLSSSCLRSSLYLSTHGYFDHDLQQTPIDHDLLLLCE
jgi:hypothetical protein